MVSPNADAVEGLSLFACMVPGRFGRDPGALSPQCTGPCDPGYGCVAGSVSPRPALCSPGRYSTSGVCVDCPAGVYGSSFGLTNASCTAPCPGGRWGAPGAGTADCSGACPAGYACPAGFTSAIPSDSFKCPAGRFSLDGSSACRECAAGYYGADVGLTIDTCSGECPAGASCPSGSSAPTPYVPTMHFTW